MNFWLFLTLCVSACAVNVIAAPVEENYANSVKSEAASSVAEELPLPAPLVLDEDKNEEEAVKPLEDNKEIAENAIDAKRTKKSPQGPSMVSFSYLLVLMKSS